MRIERDRFQVIADPFVGPAELARRVAAVIQCDRGIRVLQQVEHAERLAVAPGLGKRVRVVGECPVGQHAGLLLHAFHASGIVDLAARAGRIGAAAAIGKHRPARDQAKPEGCKDYLDTHGHSRWLSHESENATRPYTPPRRASKSMTASDQLLFPALEAKRAKFWPLLKIRPAQSGRLSRYRQQPT